MPTGSKALSKEIEICDNDGGNAHLFEIAEDRYGELLWAQDSVPAGNVEPGTELVKEWRYFGGGMGETYDVEERVGLRTGGYYFADNCQVSNPYRIRPRQAVTSVTLTNNYTEVTQMFEAKSASQIKKLYAITDTKAHRLDISGTPALKNTKDFSTPNVEFATGSYTSDGKLRGVEECSFAIKTLIIKAVDGAYAAAFKTDDMSLGKFKESTGTFYEAATLTSGISISGAQFVIGGSSAPDSINHDGTTYAWMAFGGDYVITDSFTGDGADDRDIDENEIADFAAWGQPDAIFTMTDNDSDGVCFRNKTATADLTMDLSGGLKPVANIIEATADWPTHGFEVGSDNRANRSAATVYFIAMKGDADVLEIGSYTGDAAATQAVVTPDYEPAFALIYSADQDDPAYHRSDYNAGDSTMFFTATVNAADFIISLDSVGFTVGDAVLNDDTKTYYYLVARTDPAGATICGQPAEWNSVWELPKGDDVDRAGLTTIVDGTGNDTWTARSTGEAKVQHFHTIENQLVAARSDRMCSKCSALDTDVDANWTGDYNVGPPGTVITKLVNVAGEVGVAATDGFYLFDTVSTSRQQIPYLAGIKDDDNGKGTTVIGNLVLIPTVDGLWRLVAGSTAQVDPDAQRDYVEIEGPTGIPIKLKHYGTAFLGTFIYHAVYDGTNYHIIYTRLDPYRPTLVGAKWDFLYTTTSAIKTLIVDSERRLWFSLANDIAYITLERGGAPEGGAWGATGSSGSLTLPVTKMGTSALKRLRMVEMQAVVATNFNWNCRVSRDGGTIATVGSAITSNGLGECFWTAGTSDTAREIQLQPNWTTGTYTAVSTSPPEIRRIVLHAEPLEEDADVIVCSVKLEKHPKEDKAIIDRHLNAGTLKLKNALTGVKETVHLFSRRIYQLQQADNEPPIAACELRFRHSDTS